MISPPRISASPDPKKMPIEKMLSAIASRAFGK